MRIFQRRVRLLLGLMLCSPTLVLAAEPELQLTVPPTIDAVEGHETRIYFDNIVLTKTPSAFRYVIEEAGEHHADHWSLTPGKKNVGEQTLKISVRDPSGDELSEAQMTLRVVPHDAGAGRDVRLLIVGDSLTHASQYPNEIARLCAEPGNPKLTFLGTHKPKGVQEGVAHEGYGGWTWARFVSHYEPNPDGTYRKRSSPFVYLNEAGKPALDVARYIREECDNRPPDVVLFLLGINDCFSANPDDPKAIDERIDAVFSQAETLLAAFREAAPRAELGICLTPPANAREAGFEANYKGRYTRWGWKRIQHRLVQRQLEHFGNRENENLFVVPTTLNLDPVSGYPENNGVHPNAIGYQQLAASMYAWLKWRASEWE